MYERFSNSNNLLCFLVQLCVLFVFALLFFAIGLMLENNGLIKKSDRGEKIRVASGFRVFHLAKLRFLNWMLFYFFFFRTCPAKFNKSFLSCFLIALNICKPFSNVQNVQLHLENQNCSSSRQNQLLAFSCNRTEIQNNLCLFYDLSCFELEIKVFFLISSFLQPKELKRLI